MRPICFAIDEAAACGRMDAIENGMAQLRGYGCAFLLAYQSMGQLQKVFPDGADQTVLANCAVTMFFGSNDQTTLQYESKGLGESTVRSRTENGGWNSGGSMDTHGMGNSSWGNSGGWSAAEHGRALLTPDEIRALDKHTAIVFAQGMRPLITRMVPHYSSEFSGVGGVSSLLLRSLTFVLISIALAAGAASMIDQGQLGRTLNAAIENWTAGLQRVGGSQSTDAGR